MKFSLQVYFNMNIMLNDLDRLFVRIRVLNSIGIVADTLVGYNNIIENNNFDQLTLDNSYFVFL